MEALIKIMNSKKAVMTIVGVLGASGLGAVGNEQGAQMTIGITAVYTIVQGLIDLVAAFTKKQ